jgi:hypothetical protein
VQWHRSWQTYKNFDEQATYTSLCKALAVLLLTFGFPAATDGLSFDVDTHSVEQLIIDDFERVDVPQYDRLCLNGRWFPN